MSVRVAVATNNCATSNRIRWMHGSTCRIWECPMKSFRFSESYTYVSVFSLKEEALNSSVATAGWFLFVLLRTICTQDARAIFPDAVMCTNIPDGHELLVFLIFLLAQNGLSDAQSDERRQGQQRHGNAVCSSSSFFGFFFPFSFRLFSHLREKPFHLIGFINILDQHLTRQPSKYAEDRIF